ncbi:unnamed protein product [Leptidea sinapis]|uniref:NADH dehydrogenase [ubiquinone] 1 beta subcomplex subunit 4 n=1 Tax=Leptidea sinapis TaxID=189913 RepID=A0A5E4PRU8_9NEOP|nr:unnamed protein product [Leptidea sinapis]
MADQMSEVEKKIVCAQIERRHKYRLEFLRKRTDPCQHSLQAGYVFDPAIQRFNSMKACQYEYFKPTLSSGISAFCMTILPMIIYGTLIWRQRSDFEMDCRCGRLKYRDRRFKFSNILTYSEVLVLNANGFDNIGQFQRKEERKLQGRPHPSLY